MPLSPDSRNKQLPQHAPDWLPRWDNPEAERDKTSTYLVVDEPAALIWAANYGALEWHAWTSLAARPDSPTYALIDIDPGTGTSWDDVLVLARLHRTALEHLSVRAQPKLTGRRGIQIWIPVEEGLSYHDTRIWVEQLSKTVGAVVPELVSWKWDVRERHRPGQAGLHAECQQQDPRSRPTAPAPLQGRRCRRQLTGQSSTIRPCGRISSRSGQSWTGWLSGATCSAPSRARASTCRLFSRDRVSSMQGAPGHRPAPALSVPPGNRYATVAQFVAPV